MEHVPICSGNRYAAVVYMLAKVFYILLNRRQICVSFDFSIIITKAKQRY